MLFVVEVVFLFLELVLVVEVLVVVQSVEDFVFDDCLDCSFFEDVIFVRDEKKVGVKVVQQDSDSDVEVLGSNLMVVGFQDDVDFEDQLYGSFLLFVGFVFSQNIIFLSEEEVEVVDFLKGFVLVFQQCLELEIKWFFILVLKLWRGIVFRRVVVLFWLGGVFVCIGLEKYSSIRFFVEIELGKGEQVFLFESDFEGFIVVQMLFFVMDDFDFESEMLDIQCRVDEFFV